MPMNCHGCKWLDRYKADGNGYCSMVVRSVTQTEQARRPNMERCELYQEGYSQADICQTLHVGGIKVRKVILEAGVHTERRGYVRNPKYPKKPDAPRDNKMAQAISASCIAVAKLRYPVGSHLRIKMDKGGNGLSPRRLLTGMVREAEVVNADSDIFAIVEILPSRVRDSVMWRDIYVAMRDGKPYVG